MALGLNTLLAIGYKTTPHDVFNKLQGELLNSKTLGYLIEWCDTPQRRRSGCAYLDCVVTYDEGGQSLTFQKERSPYHNIYVGVDSNLLSGVDPALQAAIERRQRIYEQTFWCIPEAYEFCQE